MSFLALLPFPCDPSVEPLIFPRRGSLLIFLSNEVGGHAINSFTVFQFRPSVVA